MENENWDSHSQIYTAHLILILTPRKWKRWSSGKEIKKKEDITIPLILSVKTDKIY